jgi:hypothetical protein
MYKFLYTPIKKKHLRTPFGLLFHADCFPLSRPSLRNRQREKGEAPTKNHKKHLVFYRGIFSTFLVLFSGRALGHYARAREKLGAIVNPIGSNCQPNWE